MQPKTNLTRTNATTLMQPTSIATSNIYNQYDLCRAPLHGHKGDPIVAPMICCAIGERAQVILMWMRAMCVKNIF